MTLLQRRSWSLLMYCTRGSWGGAHSHQAQKCQRATSQRMEFCQKAIEPGIMCASSKHKQPEEDENLLEMDTFAAFKQFRAWAESVTGVKLGTLRDDKGGEYMSRGFEAFCIEHGIQRQHTVRNHPQQNGVAERSNRMMEEGVVSMLYESGMPTAFWGEALATFIHTCNRFLTSALPDSTPHEALYRTKPDPSMLHVWGCTAYVLIQKDKWPLGSLGTHMEKCVFIEYPQGCKGWKFYNPVTKKVVISERADFDEHYFMLQRHSAPHLPPPHPDMLLETPLTSCTLPDIFGDVVDAPSVPQKPALEEMVLLLLICLLLIQFHLQALQFALRHLLPPIIHFLLLLHLHLHLHHPPLLFLLTPNTPDVPEMSVPEMSGCQRNGASQIATSSLESLHLLWSPQLTIPAILMIPWTSSKLMQPPHLSPHPSDSLSNALMQICGRRLVRKRWRLTDSMALGRLSSCPLGSVQLAPDGSWRSNTIQMAPWTTTRPGWLPGAILSALALISRRPLLPQFATPPFTLFLLWLPWMTLSFALWTFLMPISMALWRKRSTWCS